MELNFEWYPNKARMNLQKHQIGFAQAASVFKDPLAVSIIDKEHADTEERWITLGRADSGQLLTIIHTFQEIGNNLTIRIISARKASKAEQRQYEEMR